ncbi:hypothetical protein C0J52_01513 [Blattella germanica]|nr:hypothetical protein C0J52_01513 [Blattella germanica]
MTMGMLKHYGAKLTKKHLPCKQRKYTRTCCLEAGMVKNEEEVFLITNINYFGVFLNEPLDASEYREGKRRMNKDIRKRNINNGNVNLYVLQRLHIVLIFALCLVFMEYMLKSVSVLQHFSDIENIGDGANVAKEPYLIDSLTKLKNSHKIYGEVVSHENSINQDSLSDFPYLWFLKFKRSFFQGGKSCFHLSSQGQPSIFVMTGLHFVVLNAAGMMDNNKMLCAILSFVFMAWFIRNDNSGAIDCLCFTKF